METREPFSAKAINHDLFFKPSYVNPTDLLNNANSKKGYYQLIHPYMKNCHYDEPIDLTQGQNKRIKLEEGHGQYGASTASLAPAQQVAVKPPNLPNFSRPKGRKSKFYGQENVITDNRQLEHFFKHVLDHQTTETKQTEILKAAKSLFSKRTRTLYHWMYPNTPKQYIKTAVANSWDNLSTQEKQFYISQVLVRFGFPQCNLMVNPQLGGIKDLQPLPEIIGTPSSRELQTAVSSISNGEASSNAHVVPQQEAKRRQGRPMGSKNRNKSNQNGKSDDLAYKMTKDFQDDPELSKELEKFAISFDCFK